MCVININVVQSLVKISYSYNNLDRLFIHNIDATCNSDTFCGF